MVDREPGYQTQGNLVSGNDLGGIGQGMLTAVTFLVAGGLVMLPLAVWKLVDIAIWLWHHVHIHVA